MKTTFIFIINLKKKTHINTVKLISIDMAVTEEIVVVNLEPNFLHKRRGVMRRSSSELKKK